MSKISSLEEAKKKINERKAKQAEELLNSKKKEEEEEDHDFFKEKPKKPMKRIMKYFLEFEGNRYDYWEVKSIEKTEEYDERGEGMKYNIVINRLVDMRNQIPFITFSYPSEELRDQRLAELYRKCDEAELKLSILEFTL